MRQPAFLPGCPVEVNMQRLGAIRGGIRRLFLKLLPLAAELFDWGADAIGRHHSRTDTPLLRQSCIANPHSCTFAWCFSSLLVIWMHRLILCSGGTSQIVPPLFSHHRLPVTLFDAYVLLPYMPEGYVNIIG